MDLIIKPTEVCNFKCTFCSSTKISEEHSSTLDLDYVFKFLKRFPETNTIIVNGGDPLMMPVNYYWEIINWLDQHNYDHTTLSLTTNLWPFYKNPDKWIELFKHPRVGVSTSFQYGNGRLKGNYEVFTEDDFWAASNMMLDKIGYRPTFIAVITEENEDSIIKTVELAKKMDVVCKVNYGMASGDQSTPYMLSKIYKAYIDIWKAGLYPWEHNTQQMMTRLKGTATICPQARNCDSHIRTLQPEGDYYSCGAFGDDKEKPINFEEEMSGKFFTPLSDDFDIATMKQSCYTCAMFEICNGCRKTVKDQKRHGMVEEHCKMMKSLAPDIITANGVVREVTPYVKESNQRIIRIVDDTFVQPSLPIL
jgi:radical SAM protein with 4Fe4S-binding SPASM domain